MVICPPYLLTDPDHDLFMLRLHWGKLVHTEMVPSFLSLKSCWHEKCWLSWNEIWAPPAWN